MRFCSIILVLWLLTNCSGQKETYDPDTVENEVSQMLHDYHSAMGDGGLMAEFDYLDSSENFFWVPPSYYSALDFDSVKAILVMNAPTLESMTLEWEDLTVIALSEVSANFHGIVHSVSRDTAGTVYDVRMIESGTVIRRPSGWRLLNGQTSMLPLENN